MSPYQKFKAECDDEVASQASSSRFNQLTQEWMKESTSLKYSYHFEWQGRPIIQHPQDIVAVQELIWSIKPDLIIETGIAHGGSLVFSAAMLALIDMSEAIEAGKAFDPRVSNRKVLGVDVDIRAHNRAAIDAHPMRSRIDMIEGSSIASEIIEQVFNAAKGYEKILVLLDSNHTHAHVLEELIAYAPLTSVGSYCVVFDTIVEDMSPELSRDRPWGPGNNPKTAVWQYLKSHDEFVIDNNIPNKLMITVSPDGYLRRVR